MQKVTVQKVTGTLRAAGFAASRKVTITEGNRRWKEYSDGYTVLKVGQMVGIECCRCQDQIDAIFETLKDAGMVLRDLREKGLIAVLGIE